MLKKVHFELFFNKIHDIIIHKGGVNNMFIIGISGNPGAGKTTISNLLLENENREGIAHHT